MDAAIEAHKLPTEAAQALAAIEALDELVFCARKLRHSAEAGHERRRLLARIGAAIVNAERISNEYRAARVAKDIDWP